jgi:hypothetical protein
MHVGTCLRRRAHSHIALSHLSTRAQHPYPDNASTADTLTNNLPQIFIIHPILFVDLSFPYRLPFSLYRCAGAN